MNLIFFIYTVPACLSSSSEKDTVQPWPEEARSFPFFNQAMLLKMLIAAVQVRVIESFSFLVTVGGSTVKVCGVVARTEII